jgi:hypothetical protein
MATGTAKKSNPVLWEKAKALAKDKMGGKHSARAMQLATKIYKEKGGSYEGAKSPSNKLTKWTKEDWGTKSGKPSKETGERYLPKNAIKNLSDKEYKETSDAKRKGTKEGKQFVEQPKNIAEKTKKYRS